MDEKKLQLVELIKQSGSLNEKQKEGLIAAVEKLSPEEMQKVTDVFVWEKEKNAELGKEQARILKAFGDFAEEKKAEMKTSVSRLLKKIEQRGKDEDLVQIEKLLNQ